MACTNYTLSGIASSCDTSKGGIKNALIGSFNEIKDKVDTSYLGGFKAKTSETLSTYLHPYHFKKNTGSMTSTLNVDAANGINYVSTECVLQFNKMDTAKRVEIQALSMNDMAVFVQDSNNNWYYLGQDEPVNATAGTGQTGTAKGDGNFYQITLTDECSNFPLICTDSTTANDLNSRAKVEPTASPVNTQND